LAIAGGGTKRDYYKSGQAIVYYPIYNRQRAQTEMYNRHQGSNP
jgi:hypothetical protein